MLIEFFNFILRIFLKFIGIGLRGFGEFEEDSLYRKKLNSKIIQKQKATDAEELPLFDGTIESAYKVAEETNGILLMIFLNSNSGNSIQFEKSTLKDESFNLQLNSVSFKTPIISLFEISNHYHFKMSKSLGIKKFPAVAIKTKYQDKFQTVLCYEGFIDTTTLMGLVQSVLLACEAEIAQAAEITATRALQSEQDAAYLRSLEIDKEKLRQKLSASMASVDDTASTESIKNNELEMITKIDSSSSISLEKLNERISKALLDLEDEPSEGNCFKFQFSFPNGTRIIRKFTLNSTTKCLFDFVFAANVPLKNENIAIRSIEPAIEILENEECLTRKLSEIEGIGKGIKLFIEYI